MTTAARIAWPVGMASRRRRSTIPKRGTIAASNYVGAGKLWSRFVMTTQRFYKWLAIGIAVFSLLIALVEYLNEL